MLAIITTTATLALFVAFILIAAALNVIAFQIIIAAVAAVICGGVVAMVAGVTAWVLSLIDRMRERRLVARAFLRGGQ